MTINKTLTKYQTRASLYAVLSFFLMFLLMFLLYNIISQDSSHIVGLETKNLDKGIFIFSGINFILILSIVWILIKKSVRLFKLSDQEPLTLTRKEKFLIIALVVFYLILTFFIAPFFLTFFAIFDIQG